MTDAKVRAAAERYANGLSLTVVASEFGVCDRTLRREFEQASIVTRPRRGIGQAQAG
jgi:transposase-like protein